MGVLLEAKTFCVLHVRLKEEIETIQKQLHIITRMLKLLTYLPENTDRFFSEISQMKTNCEISVLSFILLDINVSEFSTSFEDDT